MRAEKVQLVKDISALLESSAHFFLMSYKGLTVADFDELRQGLAERGAECHVVPNRLLRKAAESVNLTCFESVKFSGDNAMITGGADPVAVAKLLQQYARGRESAVVRLGALDNRLLAAADVARLAELPSREILLAQLLGVLQGPARNLAGVLYAKVASIAYVLQAFLNKQEQNA